MDTRSLAAVLGLRDDGQLNDIVINYYFDILSIRENENPAYQPRVLFMSTHFSLPGKTRGSTE
jgi:Ulp1 family protease